MKKRAIAMLLLGTLCMGSAACGKSESTAAEGIYTPGIYEATVQGFGGDVKVTLTLDANSITDVKIEGSDETPALGGKAIETLPEIIKAANGSEFDAVTGATVTSTAVQEAVATCINQAMGKTAEAKTMTPGTYTASAGGMFGPITVEVTVSDSAILDIQVTDYRDSQYIISHAISELPKRIIANQSIAVDTVAGATTSSRGILAAVKDTLVQSGADVQQFSTPPAKVETVLPDEEFDLVIVGAGGAGLSAAIQARRNGDYSVLVLERNAMTGGSTALSGGGISLGNSKYNTGDGMVGYTGKELSDFFVEHTKSLDYLPEGVMVNPVLVEKIGDRSGAYFDYLAEQGFPFNPPAPGRALHFLDKENLRGIVVATPTTIVADAWGTWYTELAEKNGVKIRTNSPVTELLVKDGAVVGVKVTSPDGTYNVKAQKVILATGGYARDAALLKKNNSSWAYIDSSWPLSAGGSVGSALKLVEPLDGAFCGYGMLADMATSAPWGTSLLNFGEGVDNPGQYTTNYTLCYVNQDGDQFTDPSYVQYKRCYDLLNQKDAAGYAIASANTILSAYGLPPAMPMEDYAKSMIENGYGYQADSLEELAQIIGADPDKLVASVAAFNEDARSGKMAYYGYALNPVEEGGPYYAFKLSACILGTLSGVKLNDHFQVVNNAGEAIPNLYAAGECAQGNWIVGEYPCGSMSITCAVYGATLAADEAIANINASK